MRLQPTPQRRRRAALAPAAVAVAVAAAVVVCCLTSIAGVAGADLFAVPSDTGLIWSDGNSWLDSTGMPFQAPQTGDRAIIGDGVHLIVDSALSLQFDELEVRSNSGGCSINFTSTFQMIVGVKVNVSITGTGAFVMKGYVPNRYCCAFPHCALRAAHPPRSPALVSVSGLLRAKDTYFNGPNINFMGSIPLFLNQGGVVRIGTFAPTSIYLEAGSMLFADLDVVLKWVTFSGPGEVTVTNVYIHREAAFLGGRLSTCLRAARATRHGRHRPICCCAVVWQTVRWRVIR